MTVNRAAPNRGVVDVLDHVLGKGVVIDAWVRVPLVRIDLITRRARRCGVDPNRPRLCVHDWTIRARRAADEDVRDLMQPLVLRSNASGRPDLTEGPALASTPTNILIERSSKRQARSALAMLLPHLAGPLLVWRGDSALPANENVTLLVADVDRLTREQQEHLLHWLDAHQHQVRVIAISDSPLFPLVQRAAFSESLFYRLNMVRVGGPEDRRPRADAPDARPQPTQT